MVIYFESFLIVFYSGILQDTGHKVYNRVMSIYEEAINKGT